MINYYGEPLVIEKASGVRVVDADGRTFLDFARGRMAVSQASAGAVQGCATPLNADPLGGRRLRA